MANPDVYTVGWICAVGRELVAATAFLDEKHEDLEQQPVNDNNTYVLGRIGKHNVVIAALPHKQYGLTNAATVARDLARSFPNVRIGLMVGIGGGAPSKKHDIRLGDIVVSSPGHGHGGVFQYDYGKTIQGSGFIVTGNLNQPPQCMLTALSVLEAQYEMDGHDIDEQINRVFEQRSRLRVKYKRPDGSTDRLFKSTYTHVGNNDDDCQSVCVDLSQLVTRDERSEDENNPAIHFGLIASANQLMKDAEIRNKLSSERDVLCFEMEAAGLMNHFPCLVIRGICDYSDTHKNETWQGYAAMAAAAYGKDLLRKIPPSKVEAERKLHQVLSDVNDKLVDIRAQTQHTSSQIKDIQMSKQFEQVLKWLAAQDPSPNHNKFLKARQEGSGQRWVSSESYKDWKSQGRSFLWLYGVPGCGKTILASSIIEDLRQTAESSVRTVYFYFDFTSSKKQSFEDALRSIIYQLYYEHKGAQKHLDGLFSGCRKGKDQPSLRSLQAAFRDMAQELGKLWIVLDALDECTTHDELLAWIRDIMRGPQTQYDIHLLVTSRPEEDIKSQLKMFADDRNLIAIKNLLLKDIKNYVHARVREHEGLRRWRQRPDIQDEIETCLLRKADGMFRWVACQLDALEKCYDLRTLQKALQDLPRTLDETYHRILVSVPPEHVSHMRRILQFLLYSERPLLLAEAVDVIAVKLGTMNVKEFYFDAESRALIPEKILRYCSSLVVLVQRNSRREETQVVEEIQLAHSSVKDYLTSERLDVEFAKHFEEIAARSSIAEVCLSYILAYKSGISIGRVKQMFPFSRYAARYWSNHAAYVEDDRDNVFCLAMQLLQSPRILGACYRICEPGNLDDDEWSDSESGGPSGSEVDSGEDDSSDSGYDAGEHKRRKSGAGGAETESTDETEWSTASSEEGSEDDLLDLELDAMSGELSEDGSKGDESETWLSDSESEATNIRIHRQTVSALYYASLTGLTRCAEALLEIDGKVNPTKRDYSNSLQVAAFEGYDAIVRLLLDNGANVNSRGGPHGSPLQAASEAGREGIVDVLLAANADVNANGEIDGNALYTAAGEGHEKVVRRLLKANAMVNSKGGKYGTALQAASLGGYEDIVLLLLSSKADVNQTGGKYGTALQAASAKGHEDIVQILLDKGANVNSQEGKYGSALQAASANGYEEIVRLLLSKGGKADVQGGKHGTPLQAALLGEHSEIVQI